MDWAEVEALIEQAQQPLPDPWLESLNPDGQPYYRFLFLAAERLHPPLALELGVAHGVASAHLAAGCAPWDSQVIGVDLNPIPLREEIVDRYANYWPVVADTTAPDVQRFVSLMIDRYGLLGIVFQDSSHHYGASIEEWEAYYTHCLPGALWLCDDIKAEFYDPPTDPPRKGMLAYWSRLPHGRRSYPDRLHRGNTMGIVIL